MRLYRWTLLLMLWCCVLISCAERSTRTILVKPCATALPRLTQAWRELHQALQTQEGCASDKGVLCEALRREIERLSVDCPNTPEVLMANALLAYDERNFVRTQQLLDELFSLGVRYPEATALRARIAMEQGNTQFAIRFLDEQIKLRGDEAGLRETYASALFLVGRFDQARAQLAAAQQLGAPIWRIAYGLALIDESQGRFAEARAHYKQALTARPAWQPAESRLRALVVSGKVAP
jgi:tetratricopeptide (TPR) repeat protein